MAPMIRKMIAAVLALAFSANKARIVQLQNLRFGLVGPLIHYFLLGSCMNNNPPTFAFVSLGCPKNLVDSERMAGLLTAAGYRFQEMLPGADVVVVNTCGFIGDARHESSEAIAEVLAMKDRGEVGRVIVTGCLAQREKLALLDVHPDIDGLIGVFGRESVVHVANAAIGRMVDSSVSLGEASTSGLAGPTRSDADDPRPSPSIVFPMDHRPPLTDTERLRLTAPHVAYLKIAEGCDRRCGFCAIPQIRGKFYSKPIDQALGEARRLAEEGVKELVVIAQDTTYYGVDLYGEPRLAQLLGRLEEIEGLRWIRILYLYPQFISDELIEAIAGSDKILPYLDLPLQHINDDVLRRMRRAVTGDQTREILDRLRKRIDNLILRTTFLVGYPGETQAQFEQLAAWVQAERFPRVGVFPYSVEEGVYAETLDGPVPEDIKLQRRDRLMAIQQPIAFAWANSQIGRQLDVMIDAELPDAPGAWIGRTYADAPEIDGVVYVSGENLKAGEIVSAEMVASRGYDLVGAALQ